MMREYEMSMPKLFTCPISLELFNDPVTLCTGQTYDRFYIQKWFSAGNITCPVTMQKLHDLSFVPNHTLSHLIHQYLLNKGSTSPTSPASPGLRTEPPFSTSLISSAPPGLRIESPFSSSPSNTAPSGFRTVSPFTSSLSSPAPTGFRTESPFSVMKWTVSLSSLKHVILSQDISLEKKIEVIEQVKKLLEDLPSKNDVLVQMGLLPTLLGLIFEVKITHENMVLVEKMLDFTLDFLPFSCMNDLNLLLEESKFENFKFLLLQGNFLVKVSLCTLIQLIFSQEGSLLATKIANDTKITQGLIRSSLQDYRESYEVSEASMKAILAIISSPRESYRENMVKQGLINALVKYILEVEGKEKNIAAKATKALEIMLEMASARKSFLEKEVKNGVKALVKMVFRVSGDELGSESAVNCLIKLCSECESVEIREAVILGGVVTQILLLLQSQCCGRVKTRARLLLKLLRSMWVKDPKSCV